MIQPKKQILFWSSSVSCTSAIFSCGLKAFKLTFFGWEELICGESEFVEKVTRAGICGSDTFVLRNAIVYNGNEKLSFSLQTDNGKKTKSNIYFSAAFGVHYHIVKYSAYIVGNTRNLNLTTATAFVTAFHNLCRKAYRVNHFCL